MNAQEARACLRLRSREEILLELAQDRIAKACPSSTKTRFLVRDPRPVVDAVAAALRELEFQVTIGEEYLDLEEGSGDELLYWSINISW